MARIIGTGSYLPETAYSNEDMEKIVDTSDEWIYTRTGIRSRHFSNASENTGDMGYFAAKRALENAGVDASEIDCILVATTTPESLVPNTSSYIQAKLGVPGASCLDLNAACSGFIYGLELAGALLQMGQKKKILLIGTEVLSKITDFTDRKSCVLFGDGAGAVVLDNGDNAFHVVTGADGSKGECLSTGTFKVENVLEKSEPYSQYIAMDGKEVYKFAVNILPEVLSEAVKKGGESVSSLDHVIPHQANSRIIQAAAKKLQLPLEKFYMNIDHVGNTSAASIAIALDEMNRKKLLKKGQKIGMVGFGGGLTYGACYLTWTMES